MQIKIFNSRKLNETQEVNLFLATNNFQKECSIGRSSSAILVLDSADVSRLHGKSLKEYPQHIIAVPVGHQIRFLFIRLNLQPISFNLKRVSGNSVIRDSAHLPTQSNSWSTLL